MGRNRRSGKGKKEVPRKGHLALKVKLFNISKPLKRLLKLQKGERRRRNSACTTSSPP